jgi:hypothetical protein
MVPAWNRPVEIKAVVLATANGITFRANVPPTSGNGSAEERVRDDGKGFRLPDFVAEARLAPTSLDLRGAPPRVRFEASVDEAVSSRGPALLGEACAVRLAVVSAGDGVRDAEVVFERGPFEVFRDAAATERVAETDAIRAGDVPPGGSWRGVVYARRGELSAGSTSTLVAALRGVPTPRPEEDEAAADASAYAPASALASRKIAETALEIDVRAPFTASSASFAAYRTHALTFDAASARNQAARTLAVVRVAAEGARLAVAAEGGASDFFVLEEGDEFVRAAPGGGAASLDVAWRRVTEDGAGGEGGGEHRASVGVVSSESIARDAAGAEDAPRPPPSEAPVTVTLDAPATIRAGSPFHLFLRVKNATDAPQPVTVQVADAAGFVFAGARSRAAVVAPRSELEVGYALVPVASGEMLLPELVVHATRLEARLAPPKVARAVFVRPAGGGRAEE